MKVSELQSLMARNRNEINFLQQEIKLSKGLIKYYAEYGILSYEYFLNNTLQKDKKKLDKLVSLQKSLKREIREKVEMASERNALNLYYTRLHAHLDSAK